MQLSGKTQITQFFPNCMYCFLPSDSTEQGSVQLLNFIPEFLKSYTYLMEINNKVITVFLKIMLHKTAPLKVDSESELIVPKENCPKDLQILWDSYNVKSSSMEQTTVCPYFPNYCGTRQRGGSLSERDFAESVISTALKNASWHGINLYLGTPNNADGNCIFESIADNISSRPCFGQIINGTGDDLRKKWLNETEDLVWAFTGGLGNSEDAFRKEWGLLKTTKSYECIFGDFVLLAVAHYVKKDILVFNTIEVEYFKQQPVYVCVYTTCPGIKSFLKR